MICTIQAICTVFFCTLVGKWIMYALVRIKQKIEKALTSTKLGKKCVLPEMVRPSRNFLE